MMRPDLRKPRNEGQPIAIVGMACRFPGADCPAAFWSLLINGVDAIGEIPSDRFAVDSLYDPRPAIPGRISSRRGGFLKELDRFDAQFFGMAPREAAHLDPQQRLILEATWEAFEDAGIPSWKLAGSRTGVFVGLWLSDFEMRLSRRPEQIDVYASTGSGRHSASGRISFAFGLEGPSLTIDTACSSALTAVHLACQSLRCGESAMAVAGGANVILDPFITMAYSQAKMMAPDGRCKFGDAGANGYVRSEGAGILVLKRLEDAVSDGDPVHAVIRGSAVNNNGRSSGFLPRPAQHGHEEVLRQAYESAGVQPAEVQYVEAHGTGTIAGDPVELQALGAVLGGGRPASRPCFVGSVKTNIGHTEAAAGIAGIMKVVLALRHGTIPASLHFHEPSPRVPWQQLPLQIPTSAIPWPDRDCLPVAGVSSFGISGTNAHIVLQAAPAPPDRRVNSAGSRPHLLALSARSEKSLEALLQSYRALLGDSSVEPLLGDICGWAAVRRDHHPHRLAVTAADREGMLRHLDAAVTGETHPLVSRGRGPAYTEPRVAFVFPGQGGQWLGMGRQLIAEEPVFRAAIEECGAAIRDCGGFSVVEELNAAPGQSRLDQIQIVQPTTFAIQVALAALWRSWGIEPAALIGHSMGEVAAAVLAGALSVQDAARVICARSRLMKRLSGTGVMGVIGVSQDAAVKALDGYAHLLSIAACNSPNSTVVSGDSEAMVKVFAQLESQDVFCRLVKVDVASHSHFMEPIAEELLAALEGIEPHQGGLPIYSTVTGDRIDGSQCGPSYWRTNLRQPVLLLNAVRKSLADGIGAFLEIGPHPILESALNETIREAGREAAVAVSSHREQNERESMLAALGALYTAGCSPSWERISPAGRPVSLPAYPWDRESFWLDESGETAQEGSTRNTHSSRAIESSLNPGTFLWPAETNGQGGADGFDMLAHVLRTARELAGTSSFVLSSFELLDSGTPRSRLQRTAVRTGGDLWNIQVAGQSETGSWAAICRAGMQIGDTIAAGVSEKWLAESEVAESAIEGQDWLECVRGLVAAESSRWLGTQCHVSRIASLEVANNAADAVKARSLGRLTRDGIEAGVQVLAADGSRVAIASGIVMQPADPAATARASVHALTWEQVPAERLSPQPEPVHGAILVVSPRSELAAALAIALRARSPGGDVVSLVIADEFSASEDSFESAIESWTDIEQVEQYRATRGCSPITKLIYVAGDAPGIEELGDRAVTKRSDSTLRLGFVVQWLTHTCRSTSIPLWVVTSGVWSPCGASVEQTGCADGPVWGLTRTIVRAHPELTCMSVDTSPEVNTFEVETLATLIRGAARPMELTLREGKAYAPVFRPLVLASAAPPALRDSATYLITGGPGGVGLQLAAWMVERGARHLAFVSRRNATTDAARDAIARLEACGASVTMLSGDVSKLADVATIFETIDKSLPPLAGVVHAAGILDDAPGRWERDQLASVLAAKADGAWHLHLQTRIRPLDFFVLCSSIIASLAQPGDGTYAASNAFLDSLALYRRSLGLPAMSMAWGLWAGTGAATQPNAMRVVQSWLREGVCVLTPQVAVQAFSQLLGSNNTGCTLITPIDRARFAGTRKGDSSRGLFAALLEGTAGTANAAPARVEIALGKASPADRKALIGKTLREQLACVLRMDVARIDPDRPLGTVGLDSLLAVEFARRASTELGVKLAATTLFSYPTLGALEAEILLKIESSSPAATEAEVPKPQQRPSSDTLPPITAMSEEDAILALMGQRRQGA